MKQKTILPPRLECNLEELSLCCSPRLIRGNRFIALMILRGPLGSYEVGYWPSHELLKEIEDDVIALAEPGRVRQICPVWKAFEQVDRRLPKLRLKKRVDNLISRARALLPGESELSKIVRLAETGNAMAQCSLRDMAMKPEKFAELFKAALQMQRLLCMAEPIARWIVRIGHPKAKDFVYIAGFDPPDLEFRRRSLQSARVRRHRTKKNRQKALQLLTSYTRESSFGGS